jgi:hypothetical protein
MVSMKAVYETNWAALRREQQRLQERKHEGISRGQFGRRDLRDLVSPVVPHLSDEIYGRPYSSRRW